MPITFIVAFLQHGIQDGVLAEVWQRHQLRVLPLSGWYMQTQKRYGLVIGYTTIRSYEQALALLQGVEEETRKVVGR